MQRLIDLLGENEIIFVELLNDNLKAKFMQQAEDEGFVVNGKMPTTQTAESIMIIHKDYTVSYQRGFVAHMQYYMSSGGLRFDYRLILSNQKE